MPKISLEHEFLKEPLDPDTRACKAAMEAAIEEVTDDARSLQGELLAGAAGRIFRAKVTRPVYRMSTAEKNIYVWARVRQAGGELENPLMAPARIGVAIYGDGDGSIEYPGHASPAGVTLSEGDMVRLTVEGYQVDRMTPLSSITRQVVERKRGSVAQMTSVTMKEINHMLTNINHLTYPFAELIASGCLFREDFPVG